MTNIASPHRRLVTDFRAGELSPLLAMRVDAKAYPSGASSLKNCIIRNTGPVERRPGTSFLANLGAATRLMSFEFDESELYILAFQNNALKIYDETGDLIQSFSGTTDCPWDTTSMWEMTYAQAANTAFIAHRDFKPKKLVRTGLTTFTMADFAFFENTAGTNLYQPYYKFEADAVTLSISDTNEGTGRTITASTAIFSADWVGDIITIHGFEVEITGYTSTTVVTGTVRKEIKVELDDNPLKYTDGSTTIEVTHVEHGFATGASINIQGTIDGNNITKAALNGTKTITVIDENRYKFTHTQAASDSLDTGGPSVTIETGSATKTWKEPAFSDRRGWPGAVVFHEDRLWFGGSRSLPDALFSSRTGIYTNFDIGEGEDDRSIQLFIGSTMIPSIRHLVSSRVLQIFTERSEYVVRKTEGAGLTPSNVSVEYQTPYGCNYVAPVPFDNATLFVTNAGSACRELVYDIQTEGFQAPDITTLSNHLFKQPVDMDAIHGTATRPEQYAFFVNNDGTMAVFHSVRNEQLAAWVPWETTPTHSFTSVCALGNEVFVVALRSSIYCLERIEFDLDVTVDSAIIRTGASSAAWDMRASLPDPTGATPHNNATLHARSGDFYLGEVQASGYTYTTDNSVAVTSIQIGFDYTFEVTPMPPDMEMADGAMTGEHRRVAAVTVHMYQTLSLKIGDFETVYRLGAFTVDDPPDRWTGKYRHFLSGWDRDPAVPLTQTIPMPVTILGMVTEVSI